MLLYVCAAGAAGGRIAGMRARRSTVVFAETGGKGVAEGLRGRCLAVCVCELGTFRDGRSGQDRAMGEVLPVGRSRLLGLYWIDWTRGFADAVAAVTVTVALQ